MKTQAATTTSQPRTRKALLGLALLATLMAVMANQAFDGDQAAAHRPQLDVISTATAANSALPSIDMESVRDAAVVVTIDTPKGPVQVKPVPKPALIPVK